MFVGFSCVFVLLNVFELRMIPIGVDRCVCLWYALMCIDYSVLLFAACCVLCVVDCLLCYWCVV